MSTDALAGPIVGRDAELAQLDAMLGMLAGGASACVAVEGERGIIALENARLPTESQTRLAELQASRERIVAAGDAERRRLERNLHDGAEQRLVAIALQLRLIQSHIHGDPSSAEAMVTTASDELAQSLGDLHELARGLPRGARRRDSVRAPVADRESYGPDSRHCEVKERLPQQVAGATPR